MTVAEQNACLSRENLGQSGSAIKHHPHYLVPEETLEREQPSKQLLGQKYPKFYLFKKIFALGHYPLALLSLIKGTILYK